MFEQLIENLVDVIWHEFGHSIFGLDEEYGREYEQPVKSGGTPSELQEIGFISTDLYPRWLHNVHQIEEITKPHDLIPSDRSFDQFDVNEIRWFNWKYVSGDSDVSIIHPEVSAYLRSTDIDYSVHFPLNWSSDSRFDVPDPGPCPQKTNRKMAQIYGKDIEDLDQVLLEKITDEVKGSSVIGIYEGASGKSHNFYRSSGMCIMRTSSTLQPDPHNNKKYIRQNGGFSFCYVCKHLIVQWFADLLQLADDDKSKRQLLENLAVQFPPNKDW